MRWEHICCYNPHCMPPVVAAILLMLRRMPQRGSHHGPQLQNEMPWLCEGPLAHPKSENCWHQVASPDTIPQFVNNHGHVVDPCHIVCCGSGSDKAEEDEATQIFERLCTTLTNCSLQNATNRFRLWHLQLRITNCSMCSCNGPPRVRYAPLRGTLPWRRCPTAVMSDRAFLHSAGTAPDSESAFL